MEVSTTLREMKELDCDKEPLESSQEVSKEKDPDKRKRNKKVMTQCARQKWTPG